MNSAGANFVRVVALLEGVLSVVLSGMSLHYFAQRAPVRLVVRHVRRVTATYFAFVAYGVAEIITHWGYGLRWQLVALVVVFSLASHAQIPLLAFEREMAGKVHRGPGTVAGR